jgi:hypothetical protein
MDCASSAGRHSARRRCLTQTSARGTSRPCRTCSMYAFRPAARLRGAQRTRARSGFDAERPWVCRHCRFVRVRACAHIGVYACVGSCIDHAYVCTCTYDPINIYRTHQRFVCRHARVWASSCACTCIHAHSYICLYNAQTQA